MLRMKEGEKRIKREGEEGKAGTRQGKGNKIYIG